MHRHLHTHTHTPGIHTHTMLGYISKRLLAVLPVPGCHLCVLLPSLLPQCGHIFTLRATDVTTTTTAVPASPSPALATTATPSPTAATPSPTPAPTATPAPAPLPAAPAPFPAAASTPTSTSFLLLFPLLLPHFLLLFSPPAVYFLQVAGCGCLVVAFPDPGGGYCLALARPGQSCCPPPSHCFYLNSLPFAVQLVQFGRVIQIPQAVGGSRHTLCILTPTHCHSHSNSHSPTPPPSPAKRNICIVRGSFSVFGFPFRRRSC